MQRCKGSHDLLPENMMRFRYVEDIFRKCCLEWGYSEIRTPTLEYLRLFTSAGTLTSNMLHRLYSFLDWDGWSGERVVLRPEGTIPAVRLYIENMSQQEQAKLFYVENIFSFEETGKDSRERWQGGFELVGSREPTADAEVILLACEILRRLGIDGVELHLSHAGFLKALLGEQYHDLDEFPNGDTQALQQILAANPQLTQALRESDSSFLLFNLRGRSAGFLQNLKSSLGTVDPGIESSLDNFIMVTELLSAAGVDYQIDFSSSKGFEYYTGTLFHFHLGRELLGGGGRYDNLIPLLGGQDKAAVGFALYIDQVIRFLLDEVTNTTAQILATGNIDTPAGWKRIIEMARLLREAGYTVDIDQGYGSVTHYRWIMRLQSENYEATFSVTDQLTGEKVMTNSVGKILETLEKGQKCH